MSQQSNSHPGIKYLPFLIVTLVLYIGFAIERTDTLQLLSFYTLAFALYLFLLFHEKTQSLKIILTASISCAFLLCFSFPKLSDDIYRFIWDGRCWLNGIHPFSATPRQILALNIDGLDNSLFQKLNSKDYFTIYPLCNQLIYAFTAGLTNDIWVQAFLLKLIYFVSHLISIKYILLILEVCKLPANRIAVIALSPLFLIETTGNLHPEVLMIAMLSVGIYFMIKGKILQSAFYWTLSICSKMHPLLLLASLVFRKNIKQNFLLGILIAFFTLVMWAPLVVSTAFFSSLDLYFRKFEFNASIYYLCREIGYQQKGYNMIQYIGPLLGGATVIICLAISWYKRKEEQAFSAMEYMFFTWLLLTTTVHPWYLIIGIFLASFTGNVIAILWSLWIFYSYHNYGNAIFHENPIITLYFYLGLCISIILWRIVFKNLRYARA